jgi:iron-sulfur cluster repair protein YtfE (RIC family)
VTGLFSSAEPNAVDLLTADHRVVDRYFQEVRDHEDANHLKTYKKIQFELDAHAHIEEAIFYPYLLEQGDKELKKLVREGIEEHRQMKLFLAELDELSGDNVRFKAKLKVLMEDVEHHVDEEEDEMFPMVEDQVPREVLEKLGVQMEKEKARFQKRLTPAKSKRASAGR